MRHSEDNEHYVFEEEIRAVRTDYRNPRTNTYRADRIRVRPSTQHDDRSLGELFSELTAEVQTLVRQEIELARTEATAKATKAGKQAGFIGAGGAVAYAGLIVLLMGVAFLLALIIPLWLATIITGAAVILLGYSFVQKGLKGLKQINFTLERTAETIKEDKKWMREEI